MAEKRPRPISRNDLMSLAVTDADAFTALRYLRHRDATPAIPEIEEKGESRFPGIASSMLLDLYHCLWSPEPQVKDEVTPDRRYWQKMLKPAIESQAYADLHGATQLSELKSVLGTITMGESVMGLVSKDDGEKLQELAQTQAEANELQQIADESQNSADQLQEMAEAAAQAAGQEQPQSGQGQPSGQQSDSQSQPGQSSGQSQAAKGGSQGQPNGGKGQLTPEQAKALANQLAEAATQAKAEAQTAKAMADEATLKAEIQAEELLGQTGSELAEQKLRELTRAGLSAVKSAQTKVQEVSETLEGWGLDEGELTRNGLPEALGMLERMKRNENLRKFAALLGRVRKIAARKARSKLAGDGQKISAPETGRDIRRAHTSELVALSHPALRAKALKRWTQGELRLHGQQAKPKLGHGPVIVCEDGSGSMDGAKQQWAKAVTLSLAHYAKLQKRSFGWILFDSHVVCSQTYPQGRISASQMLELVESRAGGGTNFEKPLRSALEMIQKQGLKNADICFITDGECAVSDEFISEFKTAKNALEINVFTVLCDCGSSADKTVSEFSDRIEHASSFSTEEAESIVFSHL